MSASDQLAMPATTASESWRLWCLALTLLGYTEQQRRDLFEKQPQNERELLTRMDTIRRTRAIPVGEFLETK